MIEQSDDLLIAHECIRRATADVEIWLGLVEQGQLATVSPFGQMFVYQLKKREKLGDKKFAIDELYKLYYRKAGGKGEPPVLGAGKRGISRI
jgi:hypothetical protein